MDLIPKPDQVVSAAANVAHKMLYGGLADLRPMPRTLIDEGVLRGLRAHQTPWLDVLALLGTALGSGVAVYVVLVAVGGLALSAAACGEAPEQEEGGGTTAEKYSACMVTDVGGIDDKSFNTSAWKGLEAAKAGNENIDIKYVASEAEADYEPNLTQYVNQDCDFILAVGGLIEVLQQLLVGSFEILDADEIGFDERSSEEPVAAHDDGTKFGHV